MKSIALPKVTKNVVFKLIAIIFLFLHRYAVKKLITKFWRFLLQFDIYLDQIWLLLSKFCQLSFFAKFLKILTKNFKFLQKNVKFN